MSSIYPLNSGLQVYGADQITQEKADYVSLHTLLPLVVS